MKSKEILSGLLLIFLLLFSRYSLAVQDVDSSQQDLDQEQELVQPEQQDAESPEQDEATDEEAEESPSRFIPTEQISQDLGVTFPADI